jgi:hypothetical protein
LSLTRRGDKRLVWFHQAIYVAAVRSEPREVLTRLLASFSTDRRAARRGLVEALEGPDQAALREDPGFKPVLLAALGDASLLDELPWLASLAEASGVREAVPALIAAWSMGKRPTVREQAGQALLGLGDADGLAAMAADLPSRVALELKLSLRAALRLDPGSFYERAAAVFAADDAPAAGVLFFVASEPSLKGDARWPALAARALVERSPRVADAARALLAGLPPEVRRAAFPGWPPAVVPSRRDPAREQALAAARTWAGKLVGKLPSGSWQPAAADASARLDALESAVGLLPAAARAFYERVDGLRVDAKRAADRFVLHGLAEVEAEARRWCEANAPAVTPAPLVPPFLFPVAPDATTRAGQSGGPALGFSLPSADEDPPLEGVRGHPRFSAYVGRPVRVRR